jgi:hypothetical protein
MSGSHRSNGELDEHAALDVRRRAPDTVPVQGPDPARAITAGADPRLAHAGSSLPGLLALQRTAGNSAVASLVGAAPAVQRTVTIGEVTGQVETPGEAGGGEPGTDQAAAQATHGAVMVIGGATEINGSPIRLNAPMVEAQGVLRAETIIADNVIGSNYSPGAGNVW